jgi:MOSC domain
MVTGRLTCAFTAAPTRRSYPSEHYELWSRERPELLVRPGAFGENLTTDGLVDDDVSVGDRFRIGTTSGSSGQGLPCRAADLPQLDAQLAAGRQDPLTGERTLRVLGVRDDDADQPPALVVEDLPASATSAAG